MTEEELKDAIANLPGSSGWWHTGNGDRYQTLADTLIEYGLLPVQAYDILASAYSAAADEFGG